ncbi:hypothetical protein ACJX0J_033270, partial [Zea mays]
NTLFIKVIIYLYRKEYIVTKYNYFNLYEYRIIYIYLIYIIRRYIEIEIERYLYLFFKVKRTRKFHVA